MKSQDRAIKASLKKNSKKREQSSSNDIKFALQVRALNLRIKDIQADGNCLFRAVADQLEGNQEKHEKYRSLAVNYIQNNSEIFQPFIVEDFSKVKILGEKY